MGKRVSVINFKGGVGKTTLAFHLATGLARYHEARTLLIDMDHQSSLSIVALGGEAWQSIAKRGETVSRVFQNFLDSSLPGREIVEPVSSKAHGTDTGQVDIVPASLDLDDTEIDLTAAHQGESIQSAWNKRTLMCRWLEETELDGEYDYIIFDCAPATKVVSQNAIAASHGYIVPVVPEAVMERGAPHLRSMVQSGIDQKLKSWAKSGEARPMFVPDTQLIGLVVTRIQVHGMAWSGYTNDHTQHLRRLKQRWGDQLVGPYIKQGVGVSEALTEGVPVYDQPYSRNVGVRGIDKQFKELTENLKARMDQL